MAVLGYLSKLRRGLGLAFGAHFLHDFSEKMFLIWHYLWRKFQCYTFFPSQDIKQNVLLGCYLDNWWCHKLKIYLQSSFKGATKLWTEVIFVSATKIGENTTNILKLLFFIINLHSVTSNQISTSRKLNLSLTSQIYFVLLPLEMQQKTRTDKSILRVFLLCLKRNEPQTFKSGSCKNHFLQCVCYSYKLLRWMFFYSMW